MLAPGKPKAHRSLRCPTAAAVKPAAAADWNRAFDGVTPQPFQPPVARAPAEAVASNATSQMRQRPRRTGTTALPIVSSLGGKVNAQRRGVVRRGIDARQVDPKVRGSLLPFGLRLSSHDLHLRDCSRPRLGSTAQGADEHRLGGPAEGDRIHDAAGLVAGEANVLRGELPDAVTLERARVDHVR